MNEENENKNVAIEFIESHPLGVVSVNREGKPPHSAAVFFVTDSKADLYFLTKSGTEKYQDILADDKVSVVFSDLNAQKTLQAEGKAYEVTAEGGTIEEVYKKLSQIKPPGRNDWLPPIFKIEAGDYVVIAIEPNWMRLGDFGSTSGAKTDDAFLTIIDKR